MTTIHLAPDLEVVLTTEAQRRNTSVELLVQDDLRRLYIPPQSLDPEPPEGGSAYDFLKDFIGVIHSGEDVPGGARLSEDCGEKFTQGLLQKQRGGHL